MTGQFKKAAEYSAKLYSESVWSPAIHSWLLETVLVNIPINFPFGKKFYF